MKMYILVKQSLPSHKAVVIAHASLMGYLKYQDEPEMKEWLEKSFRKVVCEVSDLEFENAKLVEKCVVVTESSLGGAEVGLVFCPRNEWPTYFKYFKLMKI